VRLTREVFTELFGVHLPTGVPSAWVRGVRYVFVAGTDEIEELELLLLGAVTSGKT
jgi:hypothetical protein